MKRRSRAGQRPAKARPRKALKRKGGSAPKAVSTGRSSLDQTEVARLTHERDEALAQQAATADVLQTISSSPGNLDTVLETILANATRLCEANFGVLLLYEGAQFRVAAAHNPPPAFAELRRRQPEIRSSGLVARVAVTKQLLHIADCTEDPSYKQGDDDFVAFVDLCGVRTLLDAPLLKKGELIGIIAIYRQEVHLFTDQQVELVRNFAAQAVIAIENTRLLNELCESLQEQTATSEVLQVISSSPGDLQPVFEAMLEKAVRICDATFGEVFSVHNGKIRLVAFHNTPASFVEALKQFATPIRSPTSFGKRLIATKSAIQIADLAVDEDYIERNPTVVAAVELGRVRTILAVPMLKDDAFIGELVLNRQEVRPFTEKQVALVQNFASQAVIVIENARLLNELRETLQQQTATADVLKVISRSTFDLQTVLNTLVESAARLCAADRGLINHLDGDLIKFGASYGFSREAEQYALEHPARVGRDNASGRVALEGRTIHIPDVLADLEYRETDRQKALGYRTLVGVPLLRQGTPIGVFALTRDEVNPFTDKQIELVTTFGDQAVIAIENASLLNELRQRTADLTESLEQQTATSEVLQVISSSPGDLEPVFEAMLVNAVRICDAKFGNIYRWDGEALNLVATHNTPPAYAEFRRRTPFRADQKNPVGRMITTKTVVQVTDLATEQGYVEHDPGAEAAFQLGGLRTFLAVPMLKENELIGAFVVSRVEVRPFTDRQTAVVTSFAAQAVIAIENARLLKELRERTEDVVKLNQQLEQRVADQVGEIERMGRLRRFLPPQVADLIVASGTEKQLESHRREITALFCDLRGFTGFTESADAEDVMALLRDYHSAIGEIIIKYSGTLERYAGDGVMVIFNDPVPVENPALQAVLMALEMRDAIGALTEKWSRLGHEIGFGIGIAHGYATLGTIGFEGRHDYAAIGTVSNVASRLCDEAKPGQILISPRVLMAVKDAVMVEAVGEFELKGIRRPIAAHNVLAAASPDA